MGIPRVDPTAPPSFIKRVGTPLAVSKAGTWYLKNVSRRIDPFILRVSGGRFSSVVLVRVVLVTTTGARSGLKRTVPLVYFTDGDDVVLIASNYGGAKHPNWYHNVRANPEVTMYAGGFEGRFVGRLTEGDERARLWGLATTLTRGYANYQNTTQGREIQVLAFTPVT